MRPCLGLAPLIPFRSLMSPYLVECGAHLDAWVRDWALAESRIRAEQIRQFRYDDLICRVFPTAGHPELMLISEVVVWMFLYDDHFDIDRLGHDAEVAARSADSVILALHGHPPPAMDVLGPLLCALADLRLRLRDVVPGELLCRLDRDLEIFVRSVAREVTERVHGTRPGLEEYLTMRLETFAWGVVADLVEVAGRMRLPAAVRAAPECQGLLRSAGEVMCAINDLYSLPKELHAGEWHNLVLVLQHEHRCRLPHAIECARAHLDRNVQRFVDYATSAPAMYNRLKVDSSTRRNVEIWISGLQHLMRGQLDWCTNSCRYLSDPAVRDQGPDSPYTFDTRQREAP